MFIATLNGTNVLYPHNDANKNVQLPFYVYTDSITTIWA